MQLWIIGTYFTLLGFYFPATKSIPIGPSFGSPISFRPKSDQHAEFGEGIRDWFRNVKNRVFGGTDDQALPPAEAGRMIMELENEDPQIRRRNPGGLFLDLTNLTFDPANDWGFHLGKWYFIRKSETSSTDDWNSSYQPTYPEWPTIEEGSDDSEAPPFITMENNNPVTTAVTSTSKIDTQETTEPAIPEVNDDDNETRNTKNENRSTEVLLPSE